MEGTGTAAQETTVPVTVRHAAAAHADVMNTESPAEAVIVTSMMNPAEAVPVTSMTYPAVPVAVITMEGIPA